MSGTLTQLLLFCTFLFFLQGLAAIPWLVAVNRRPFGEIRGIPTTLIIDRQGRLAKSWAGYGEGMAKRALDEALKAR